MKAAIRIGWFTEHW